MPSSNFDQALSARASIKKIVNVTSAQLKDLIANPVELIPAPGTGKINVLLNVIIFYNFGTIAYTQANGSSPAIGYSTDLYNGNAEVVGITEDSISLVEASSSPLTGSTPIADIENLPILLLSDQVAPDDLAAGDGTLRLILEYIEVSIT